MTYLHPSRLGYYDDPTEQAIYLAPLPDGEISRLEGPALFGSALMGLRMWLKWPSGLPPISTLRLTKLRQT